MGEEKGEFHRTQPRDRLRAEGWRYKYPETWWQLKPREAEGKVTEVRLGSASEGIQVTKKMIESKARTCT